MAFLLQSQHAVKLSSFNRLTRVPQVNIHKAPQNVHLTSVYTALNKHRRLRKADKALNFSLIAVSLGVMLTSIDSWSEKQPLGPSFICKNISYVSLNRYNYSPMFFSDFILLIMTNHSFLHRMYIQHPHTIDVIFILWHNCGYCSLLNR